MQREYSVNYMPMTFQGADLGTVFCTDIQGRRIGVLL
jgi:hypothetical protein